MKKATSTKDKKVKEVEVMQVFFKQAFCIEGICEFHKVLEIEGKLSTMFKLTDSKRGEFFVTISK